ncbi:MAG: branched-chain amino acid ABC transporter permease [Candidatus Bathyarchaeia archaeon]
MQTVPIARYFRKIYTNIATHIYDRPPRTLAFLIIIMLSILPYSGMDLIKLEILTSANLIAILAASWDLLVGRTGQISLGHALFFGLGAYTTALFIKYLGWPFWITIPISVIVGAGVALTIGIPCLRLKGPYLALVTMAFPLALQGFLYYYRDIFGGETGIGLPKIFPGLRFFDRIVANYYLSLALLVLSSIIIYKIATSKTGIIFISILDDEIGAKACAINTTKYKLMSLAISGLFGSLAGAFYGHIVSGSANPRLFVDTTALMPMEFSLIPIIAAVLGGVGTIYGPIVGVYIYQILYRYILRDVITFNIFGYIVTVDRHMQLFIFISFIVLLIVKWPRGVARAIVEKLEDLEEPRELEEILKEKTESKQM